MPEKNLINLDIFNSDQHAWQPYSLAVLLSIDLAKPKSLFQSTSFAKCVRQSYVMSLHTFSAQKLVPFELGLSMKGWMHEIYY